MTHAPSVTTSYGTHCYKLTYTVNAPSGLKQQIF